MFSEELKNTTNPSVVKIGTYLQERAQIDPSVAKALEKENKSLDECYRYILGEAFKSIHKEGNVGGAYISPEDVYSMAVHYYDEDDIKISPLKGVRETKVVSEHKTNGKQSVKPKTNTKITEPKKTTTSKAKKKTDPIEGQLALF